MCIDGLLQLFLFSSSAVAELSSTTKTSKYCKVYSRGLSQSANCSHRPLLHEAGEELVDVCTSFQEALSSLLRLLLRLVGGNLQPSLQCAEAATLEPKWVETAGLAQSNFRVVGFLSNNTDQPVPIHTKHRTLRDQVFTVAEPPPISAYKLMNSDDQKLGLELLSHLFDFNFIFCLFPSMFIVASFSVYLYHKYDVLYLNNK